MDLHLHTPASSDYQEPKATYLDILHTAEARGLDIMAFADHNTVGGLRRLREEIAELELLERLHRLQAEESERLNEYRRLLDKILLLPGFEFTATFGFHIMGIFPPETTVRELEHLLLSLNVPKEQLDAGSVTVGPTSDVLTAYRLISEAGGLPIAAHANSTNGVAMRGFGFGGQTKIAFTQDPNLAALEVTDLDQKGRRTTAAFFSGSKPEYPRRMHCITGSDAHRLARDPNNTKNLGIGDRATDLLLEAVSFEALRDLFRGSDFARMRPHVAQGTVQAEFDYVQQAREEGPNIVQAFHDSMTQKGGRLHDVIEDVCAMVNTNGGTIYVGVSPDPKQLPVGVLDLERSVKELQTAIMRQLTPQLACTVDTLTTRGKKIIRVLVPRGDDPPYAIDDNKIFVREEAESTPAVRDEIVQLVLRGRGLAGASQPATEAKPVMPETAPAEPVASPMPAPAPVAPPVAGVGVGAPRTGVEIVATDERDGSRYHAMRDLRNGSVVKNVTRSSARKLWHYAISAKESGALNPEHVTWQGDIGLWRKTQKGGTTRFDLVQRGDGEMRVYYGVTEDGIHGAWRRLIEAEDRRSPESAASVAELVAPLAPAPSVNEAPAEVQTLEAEGHAPEPMTAAEAVVAEMAPEAAAPALESAASEEAAPEPAAAGQEERPTKTRSRGGRSTKKTTAKSKATPVERPARKSTTTKAGSTSRPRTRRTAGTDE
jgi:hypothetical protein